MQNETSNNCVLLFGKSPRDGDVKTRLADEIGSDYAVEFYKCSVEDSLTWLKSLNIHFKFYFWPPDAEESLLDWLGGGLEFTAQKGNNLGEKMNNAFIDAFEDDFEKVLIVGSDSPDLPAEFINMAFDELKNHDAVIGPSSDGGYYLIGFKKKSFCTDVFDDILWSSSGVLEKTLDILEGQQRRVYLLPEWHDVDTLSDLKDMLSRNRNTVFNKSKTFACLNSLKFLE
ncbi:MAG: TIGR04282 family arsenosugar biosynthesis glycosyltransferase [Planctomycetota bacterium]